MIRTIVSILVTLALLLGVSICDIHYVQTTFRTFHSELRILKQKAELDEATYSDGLAVRSYWDTKKKVMHIWVPHTALAEIDFQLDEAIGYLSIGDCDGALPNIEVLLGLSENIPDSYTLSIGNIF